MSGFGWDAYDEELPQGEAVAKDAFELEVEAAPVPKACSIDSPDCEACQ